MQNFADTTLQSKSGREYPYSLLVHTTCKGQVTSVDVLEQDINGAKPRPYMFLDLLAKVFPSRLYINNITVEYGENPVLHPEPGYTSHPCLIVYQNGKVKRYRLDQNVGAGWPVGVPSAHLRAMVAWWRINREEFNISPHTWNVRSEI